MVRELCDERGKVDFHFGDYYSCAYFRIEGGKDVKKKLRKPKFKPGNKKKRCRAMTNTRGACEIEPCPNAYGAGAVPEWMCRKGMMWKKKKCRSSKKGKQRTKKREESKKKQKKKSESKNKKRKASKKNKKESKKRR